MLIVNDYSHRTACKELGLKPRTVERWRHQLIAVGREFFGFEPHYKLCAQYAVAPKQTTEELRKVFGFSVN